MSSGRASEPQAVDWMDGLAYWTTRGFWAVVDQALFAISNLIVNVLLARWLSPREYGAFVTAYVVLLLVGVAHSSLLIEPMLVLGPSRYAGRFKEYFAILLRFQYAFGAVAAATLILIGAAHLALGQPLLGNTFLGLGCAAPFIFLSWLVRRACYLERKPAAAALGGTVYILIAGLGAVVIYNLGLLTSMVAQLLMGVASCAAAVVTIRTIGYRGRSGQRLSIGDCCGAITGTFSAGAAPPGCSTSPKGWSSISCFHFMVAWKPQAALRRDDQLRHADTAVGQRPGHAHRARNGTGSPRPTSVVAYRRLVEAPVRTRGGDLLAGRRRIS